MRYWRVKFYEGRLFFCTALIFVGTTFTIDLAKPSMPVFFDEWRLSSSNVTFNGSYRCPTVCDNIFLSYEFIIALRCYEPFHIVTVFLCSSVP